MNKKNCLLCNKEFNKNPERSHKSWEKAKYCSSFCADQSRKMTGENNLNWKGDKVGYGGVHAWVKKVLGKPLKCENPNCKYPRLNTHTNKFMLKPKCYEWANKSGNYLRNINDWLRLCSSCHKRYDHYLIPRCP